LVGAFAPTQFATQIDFFYLKYIFIMTSNKVKGDLYENYILEFLKTSSNQVYLWKNIPEIILHELGYITDWNQFRLEKIKYKLGEEYDYNILLIQV
jgi:hypothetical protein